MASSTAEPMPQTVEAYKALAQRDLELIMEMKAEIDKLEYEVSALNKTVAKLRFRLDRLKSRLSGKPANSHKAN